jgi:hypothetical protein
MWQDVPANHLFEPATTQISGRNTITAILRAMVARGMRDHIRVEYWDVEQEQGSGKGKGKKRGRRRSNEDPFQGKRRMRDMMGQDGLESKRFKNENS